MKFCLEGGVKKIGSNFRLSGQKLFLDFKNPFKIIANAEPERSEGEAKTFKNAEIVNWRWVQDSNLQGHFARRFSRAVPYQFGATHLRKYFLPIGSAFIF